VNLGIEYTDLISQALLAPLCRPSDSVHCNARHAAAKVSEHNT